MGTITAPARIVRVTSFTDDLYALDVDGVLWSLDVIKYRKTWTQLPRPADFNGPIVDLYIHVSIDPWESLRHVLRVLDASGKLWELRWVTDGKYMWDSINLEAR